MLDAIVAFWNRMEWKTYSLVSKESKNESTKLIYEEEEEIIDFDDGMDRIQREEISEISIFGKRFTIRNPFRSSLLQRRRV
jgi:hypothetical protein